MLPSPLAAYVDRWLRIAVTSSVLLTPTVSTAQTDATSGVSGSAPPMPSLWELAVQGGIFMIPIALASIVAIAFSIERMIGLKTERILPAELILKLRKLISERGIDPRKAWAACQEHPSPLANSLQAAILKAGRPHAEVEKAVEDAVGRETSDMLRNLRPVNVVASIAPLLGLLGTVQGMILAFMVTSSTSSTGNAKAAELAQGIYTALVTTFAGLSVAVVSVLLANYLEGRIERLLRLMEDLFVDLLPHLERFEGKLRVARAGLTDDAAGVQLRTKRSVGVPETTGKNAAAGSQNRSQESDSRSVPFPKVSTSDDTTFEEAREASPDGDVASEDDGPTEAAVVDPDVPRGPQFSETGDGNAPLPPDKNKIDSPHGLWDIMWEHREAQQVVDNDADE
jgi:biopolymer transport protein ExbB